jgi:hypothetical protein
MHPVPKPKARVSQPQKGLQRRVRIKCRNAKRKGSSFPKQRDPVYRRWIWTENPCMLAERLLRGPVSLLHDAPYEHMNHNAARVYRGWWHNCWGGNTPAHVGKHQAKGAPDFGVLVPLCRVAHQFYDEHRKEWAKATGFTEKKMASAASGYALKYVELGGVPVLSGKETT